ncbi:baculoviral IAP repeat-containing protein 1a [Cricetulus griseus]|nr:baculoviral IAP repeat-containing protein 1a [Cricetulus griseus]
MATHGEASEERVSEFDYDFLPELSALLGMDAGQLVKSQEEENHKERMKMKKGFNSQMRSEAKRLKTFVTYDTFSSWTPQDMAAAGFYLTGVKLGVQCFCCSLILFGTNLRKIPIERHRELRPECEFLLGKDVGNIGKYDVRVKSPEKLRGDKARYQEEEARLESFENWPFYAHGTSPRVLSAAGFVFTGKRDTVQCFSCGGCLGNWEEGDNPWKEHAKWFPKCEFLQSKKSSEEIAQYIKSYEGFVHVTGEHFVNSWVRRELPVVSAYCNDSVFANEELRLDTFKDWPHNSPGAVEALVRAGLFYTGIRDIVQCFSCDGCMENWKEGDDPLEDHTKFYPNCVFLQYLKSSAEVTPALQSHCEIPKAMDTTGGSNHEDPVTVLSTVADVAPSEAQGCECPSSGACVLSTDLAQSEAQWLQEAKSLSEQLRAAYTKATFRHMNLPELVSDKESLENMSENEDYGKTQPKTSRMMQLIKGMWQPPMIDEDYASTFEHMKEWEKNLAENEDKLRNFMNNQPQCPPNISAGYWKLSPKQHKIPRLEVGVTNMGPADQALLQVLMEVFSASQDIELHLMHSSGFLESIRPALELNKTSVTKCSLCRLRLSAEEQQLLLALPALRSLEVSGTNQLPDQLFPNLDKFPSLRELSVRLDGSPDVLSVIPGDLPNFHHMEKLSIQTSTESDLSKLVKLIQNSPNLHVFHLKCDFFSDFESLMTVLASCKELREMEFSGRCFETRPFVTILPNFVSLKILNLECQQFPDKETSEKFAQALGSLRNLEELLLPTGDGIQQVAKLIVQQCLQLPCLRVLVFHHILDDDSVMEIAKGATSGGFQKLETLDLSVNHKITEEGYRNFFQALDNLPNLQVLNICRSLPERIQVQATTVKALSQCVSRLPSLTRLEILSWLLDEEDMKVINAVKERHPQSKRLTVLWKWIVPFSPVIQK